MTTIEMYKKGQQWIFYDVWFPNTTYELHEMDIHSYLEYVFSNDIQSAHVVFYVIQVWIFMEDTQVHIQEKLQWILV